MVMGRMYWLLRRARCKRHAIKAVRRIITATITPIDVPMISRG